MLPLLVPLLHLNQDMHRFWYASDDGTVDVPQNEDDSFLKMRISTAQENPQEKLQGEDDDDGTYIVL